MAVKIRLARYGKKKRPFYRIVVAKDTSPRDGRFIALLGTYDPCSEPPIAKIDTQKASQWLQKRCTANPVCHADIETGWCFPKVFSTSSVEYLFFVEATPRQNWVDFFWVAGSVA